VREDYGEFWNMGRADCWSWEVEEERSGGRGEGIKWDAVAMALRMLVRKGRAITLFCG
jgi:hypothetical protein